MGKKKLFFKGDIKSEASWDIRNLNPLHTTEWNGDIGGNANNLSCNELGTIFIVQTYQGYLFQLETPTPYNLDVAINTKTQFVSANITSHFMKPDFTKLFVCGSLLDGIDSYQMTPNDVNSIWDNQQGYNISNPVACSFSEDGLTAYTSRNAPTTLGQHKLTTAWDVTTMSYFTGKALPGSPKVISISWKPDGSRVFLVISFTSTITEIHQYDLTTAWKIATIDANSLIVLNSINDLGIKSLTSFSSVDGKTAFCSTNSDDRKAITIKWD